MARRHESLIPLAKDHYEGLLLVQQLREHGRTIMSGWPHPPAAQAQFVARFYDEHLKNHFEAEEQALFPLASEHIVASRSIINELSNEHRTIEGYSTRFRASLPTIVSASFSSSPHSWKNTSAKKTACAVSALGTGSTT